MFNFESRLDDDSNKITVILVYVTIDRYYDLFTKCKCNIRLEMIFPLPDVFVCVYSVSHTCIYQVVPVCRMCI